MNLRLILNGKTDFDFVDQGTALFAKRIQRYISFEVVTIPALKNTQNMPHETQKKLEGEALMKLLTPGEVVVLLDEKGRKPDSVEFAQFIQKQMNLSVKTLSFVIGGPYGFSESIRQRADHQISLSPMTFSHQLIRVIFTEQLYRAFTIIKGEPYHNA